MFSKIVPSDSNQITSKFFPVKLVFVFTHILCFSKSNVCSEMTMEGPIGSDGMANLSRLPENFGIFLKIPFFLKFFSIPRT